MLKIRNTKEMRMAFSIALVYGVDKSIYTDIKYTLVRVYDNFEQLKEILDENKIQHMVQAMCRVFIKQHIVTFFSKIVDNLS